MSKYHGCIDICQQTVISGWALEGDRPTPVFIGLNSDPRVRIEPTISRPDVAALLSADPLCGFSYHFPRSLRASDVVWVSAGETDIGVHPHLHRVASLTYGISSESRGIEIGPLHSPFLDRKHFNVHYIDHASRDDLEKKYRRTGTESTFKVEQLVDVDVVWAPGRTLRECCDGMYQYAVASHVMEHVGNPIKWLNDIAACLSPGGRINLALPHAERTFDRRRRLTKAAEMVEAFEYGYDRPMFRQVFDHVANHANPPKDWDHSVAALKQALTVARAAQAGDYVDVHYSVWTHDSFLECWEVIETLALCKARLDKSWTPVASSNEFILSFVV